MTNARSARAEPLLTVGQAAGLLGTIQRFPRRLIAERRIRFVRVGRHVRIPESALAGFIAVHRRRGRGAGDHPPPGEGRRMAA